MKFLCYIVVLISLLLLMWDVVSTVIIGYIQHVPWGMELGIVLVTSYHFHTSSRRRKLASPWVYDFILVVQHST